MDENKAALKSKTNYVFRDRKNDLWMTAYRPFKRLYDNGVFEWEPIINHSFDGVNAIKLNDVVIRGFKDLTHDDEPVEVVILPINDI